MLLKLFIGLILVMALVVGFAAVLLRPDQIISIIKLKDFFDFSITILAFGALVKYLCTCPQRRD
jgi:hypothetical protein